MNPRHLYLKAVLAGHKYEILCDFLHLPASMKANDASDSIQVW